VRSMTTQPELDFSVDLAQVAPHFQLRSGVFEVTPCSVDQLLQDLGLPGAEALHGDRIHCRLRESRCRRVRHRTPGQPNWWCW
jgi:hypothetical protein